MNKFTITQMELIQLNQINDYLKAKNCKLIAIASIDDLHNYCVRVDTVTDAPTNIPIILDLQLTIVGNRVIEMDRQVILTSVWKKAV